MIRCCFLLLSVWALTTACGKDPSGSEEEKAYALMLNGASSYVQVRDTAALDAGTGDFTWEVWVRRARMGVREDVLDKKDVLADAEHDLALLIDDRNRANAFLGQDAFSQVYLTSTSVIDTAWTHLAVTRSNGIVTLYVNGVAERSAQVSYDVSSTGPLRIGANRLNNAGADAAPVFPFAGLIDDVRIWNTARTAQQIQSGMQERVRSDAAGLVASFRFNEGEGILARDDSGRGNNGELRNGAGWMETPDSPVP